MHSRKKTFVRCLAITVVVFASYQREKFRNRWLLPREVRLAEHLQAEKNLSRSARESVIQISDARPDFTV